MEPILLDSIWRIGFITGIYTVVIEATWLVDLKELFLTEKKPTLSEAMFYIQKKDHPTIKTTFRQYPKWSL